MWEHWEGKTFNFLSQMTSARAAWELGCSGSSLWKSRAKQCR